jgi:adenosylcobinamide kinase / adenosylcobinamide-phosphate guanylyltransferase
LTLTLLIGGARSGKSALAVRMASSGLSPITLVATAEALDDEMAARIAAHRSERPSAWATVEEPLDLESALSSTTDEGTVVIDCLTLWVANLLGAGRTNAEVLAHAGKVAVLAGERPGKVVVVSNDVGSGIVPGDALSRRYRDLMGRVNSVFAEQAADAFLVVAGLVVPLMPAPAMAGPAGPGPSQAEPSQAAPSQAEPSQAEPSQAAPGAVDSVENAQP